jgi:hypothetical protein
MVYSSMRYRKMSATVVEQSSSTSDEPFSKRIRLTDLVSDVDIFHQKKLSLHARYIPPGKHNPSRGGLAHV